MKNVNYRRSLNLLVLLTALLLAACGSDSQGSAPTTALDSGALKDAEPHDNDNTEDKKDPPDTKSADIGPPQQDVSPDDAYPTVDSASKVDANPAEPWTPEDIDWNYIPFPSEVTADECTSLTDASPSHAEAGPNAIVSVAFSCAVNAAELNIRVGQATTDVLQISPTLIGFLIPTDTPAGAQTIHLSGPLGEVDFTMSVLAPPDAPPDPKAYLSEVISFQKALAANLSDPLLKARILAVLADAETDIAALSPEDAHQAAALIRANEEALGLQENAICQIQGSTPEKWWNCFEKEIRQRVKYAATSGLLAGAGLTFLGTPLAPVGIIISGVGIGAIAYNLGEIADDMLALTVRVIQVVGNEAIDIVVNKSNGIASGTPFSLTVEANYITYSGASMGNDASMLRAFLDVINEAHDLVTRINETLETGIELYSLASPAQTKRLPVDPQYLSVALAPGTDPAISESIQGMNITLTSTASEPVPVTLLVSYELPGVRSASQQIGLVVQPGPNPFIHLTAAGDRTCGLRVDGTIDCWGALWSDMIPGVYAKLSLGYAYLCGIQSDGSIHCNGPWGPGDTPPPGTYSQVSTYSDHTCAVRTSGSIVCWGGDNRYGEATAPAGSYQQVEVGSMHTCALRTNGTIACWGFEDSDRISPPSGGFEQLSVGSGHACATTVSGSVTCWGHNAYNQATSPTGAFSQISAGAAHTCGLKTDGSILCWGSNGHGQLSSPPGTFIYVTVGQYHSCALRPDGYPVCWGDNANGQTTPPTR